MWVMGIVTAVSGGVIAWLVAWVVDLQKSVSKLEARPYVDPVDYTKVIAEVTAALTALTIRISESIELSRERYVTLSQQHNELKQEMEKLRREVEDLRRKLNIAA